MRSRCRGGRYIGKVGREVLKVANEATGNALQHASPHRIRARLDVSGVVRLTVSTTGVGLTSRSQPAPPGRTGNRAAAVRHLVTQRDPLTTREREVLRLIGQGTVQSAYRPRAGVVRENGEAHVSAIVGNLGVADRIQAALLAVRDGLVDP
jgi:DNA-binding NarL/FixJ family response regulator